MNSKILVFAICVEALIYLSYNLHDCTFKLNSTVLCQGTSAFASTYEILI